MRLNIPFHKASPTPGHPNGVHCVETSLKMILGYFEPDKEYSIQDLEQITGKSPETASWEFKWSLWFVKQGYEVKHYSTFNYHAFKDQGVEYIRQEFGDETANWQQANSDIDKELSLVDDYLAEVEVVNKNPTIADIKKEFDAGFVIKVGVNSNVLNDKEGYEGHSVVVVDIDDNNIWFHDPGLPAFENRKMSHQKLQQAMDSFGGELDLIKK